MDTQTRRRGILYSGATIVAAVLLVLGFGVTLPPDLGTRLSGASMLAMAGSFDEALAEIELGIREHPDKLDGYIYRATLLARMERYDEAIEAYGRAIEHEEAEGDIRRRLQQDRASVLLVTDRTAEFQTARDDLAAGGMDQYVFALDAIAAQRRDDLPEAARHFRKALTLEDTRDLRARLWDVIMTMGIKAIADGRLEEAESHFSECSGVMPGNAKAFLKGGEVRLAENDAKGALVVLKACPKDAPGLAPLLFRCGTAMLNSGDSEAALDAFGHAVLADKDSVVALLDSEPAWAALREDARCKAILAEQPNQENESESGTAPGTE
ncbi:MAG: tetratricopeptide repeat protein [Planctomycetota bacterium]